ncbi:unnamed protein product [Aphanomyces euteiches]
MTTKRSGSTFLDEATAAFTVQASPILSRTVDPSKEYGWTQTEEELYIYVPVRPRIVRKGVNVLATQAADGTHWFTVVVDTIPRIHAKLAAMVNCKSLDWEIAPQKEASPFYTRMDLHTTSVPMEICITLVKHTPGEYWPSLLI